MNFSHAEVDTDIRCRKYKVAFVFEDIAWTVDIRRGEAKGSIAQKLKNVAKLMEEDERLKQSIHPS